MRKESRNPSGRMTPRVVAWGLSALLVLGASPAPAFAGEAGEVGVAPDQAEVVEGVAGGQAQLVDGQTAVEQPADEVAAVEEPAEVAQPADEVAVEETSASVQVSQEANAVTDQAELATDPQTLEVQADTQRTLALNGRWHDFYPYVAQPGCSYEFTLSKASVVQLTMNKNCTTMWSLWNKDTGKRYWQSTWLIGTPYNSEYCYLRPGTYSVELYVSGTGSINAPGNHRVSIRATAEPATVPVRGNSTFDTATPLRVGSAVGSLFTRDDDVAFYKFTVAQGKVVRITCQEKDNKINTVDSFALYGGDKQSIIPRADNNYGDEVVEARVEEKELPAGTYYIRVARGAGAGGPYTIKWETVDKAAANGGGANQGGSAGAPGRAERAPRVSYRTHVQRVGWQPFVADGAMSGTTGRSLRLEGINISLSDLPCAGGIQYRTHVQRIGWQGWRADGQMAGTSGMSRRLEAIEVRLTGELASRYDVYYRVHCQKFGWMGWAKNGARSGSAGYSRRLEGIQVVLVRKGQPAPGATYRGVTQRYATPFRQR